MSNPTGDYGVKQVIETTHTLKDGGGDVVIDEWSYRWDQMYNKTKRTNVRGGRNGPIYTYSYDDAYRLTHSQRQAGMTTSNTYYTLDGTNNRRLVRTALGYPPPPDNYVLDDTVPPADEQMNQYTETPFDERTYDESGNLSTWTDGSTIDYEATYDYRNQMTSVFDDVTDETTDYRYDALGRRIERDVDGAVTRYYYFGWRVVEEQDGQDDTVATYVYGNYIDEPLQMRRDLGEGMEDFYYHQDDMFNVMALTDAAGNVVERYDYKDYGEPIIYDGSGQVISGTAYGNPYLFNGRRYDPETGFYYYRTRYLDPKVGRFTTRDTIGIWGDPANLGNAYAYVGNNPWALLDPYGEGPLEQFTDASRALSIRVAIWYAQRQARKAAEKEQKRRNKVQDEWGEGWGGPDDEGKSQGNCYRYVCNDPIPEDTDTRTTAGKDLHQAEPGDSFTKSDDCESMMTKAVSEGLLKAEHGKCPPGYTRVALVMDLEGDQHSFHWLKEDSCGNWSHKPGTTPVSWTDCSGNPVDNPETANFDYSQWAPGLNYNTFCGYMCVPGGGCDID